MKKMLLKNWFWIVVLFVLGIKYGFTQGLQAVKKYDLPVYVVENDQYTIENVRGLYYEIRPKSETSRLSSYKGFTFNIEEYKEIISFFKELKNAEPTLKNYNYEITTKNYEISVNKRSPYNYFGSLRTKDHRDKWNFVNIIRVEEVEFLASLPLDIKK